MYPFIGRHFIASYCGCATNSLTDHARLLSALERGARAAGATVLDRSIRAFAPEGFTAVVVVLLSESHATIHTYPEHRACFVDLFTCGLNCSAEKFDVALCEWLRPTHVDRRVFVREVEVREDGLSS